MRERVRFHHTSGKIFRAQACAEISHRGEMGFSNLAHLEASLDNGCD